MEVLQSHVTHLVLTPKKDEATLQGQMISLMEIAEKGLRKTENKQ